MTDMFLPNLTQANASSITTQGHLEYFMSKNPSLTQEEAQAKIDNNITNKLYGCFGPNPDQSNLYGLYVHKGLRFALSQENIDDLITISQAKSEGWLNNIA